MLGKLKEEWQWIIIFLVAQVGLFSLHYREFETKFFPVVENYHVSHVSKYTDEYIELYVDFEKVRDCEYVGIRAIHPSGSYIRVQFKQEKGDNSLTRPVGKGRAGPWHIYNDNFSNIQVDVLHKCDWFGITRTVMQTIKE